MSALDPDRRGHFLRHVLAIEVEHRLEAAPEAVDVGRVRVDIRTQRARVLGQVGHRVAGRLKRTGPAPSIVSGPAARQAEAAEVANELSKANLREAPDPTRRERWEVEGLLRDNIIHALERCGRGWTLKEVDDLAIAIVAENHHVWPDFSRDYLVAEFPEGERWVEAPVFTCEMR